MKKNVRKFQFDHRRILVIIATCLAFCLLCLPSITHRAAAQSQQQDAREELSSTIESLLNELDLNALQDYLKTLSQFEGVSIKDKIKSVVSGNFSIDYSSVGRAILGFVWEETQSLLPAFAIVLAVSLLCGILNNAKSGFLHSSMSDIIGFCGYASVGSVVLSCLISVLTAGFSTITQMQKQMEIVLPILLTLMSASGEGASVAVYRPATAFMSGAMIQLFASVVLPISVIVIVLSFVGNLSEEVKTQKLSDFFKSISKWMIGFMLGLFALFLSVQGIASAQYDGLSLKAVKYVLSGSVPIVGGFLSGSVEFIVAGSALIKNALGAFSIFMLVSVLVKPLVLFAVFQLFLRVCAAATEQTGGRISTFLSQLASDMGYFVAALLCVAFVYFLTLLLFVCSSGALF